MYFQTDIPLRHAISKLIVVVFHYSFTDGRSATHLKQKCVNPHHIVFLYQKVQISHEP